MPIDDLGEAVIKELSTQATDSIAGEAAFASVEAAVQEDAARPQQVAGAPAPQVPESTGAAEAPQQAGRGGGAGQQQQQERKAAPGGDHVEL